MEKIYLTKGLNMPKEHRELILEPLKKIDIVLNDGFSRKRKVNAGDIWLKFTKRTSLQGYKYLKYYCEELLALAAFLGDPDIINKNKLRDIMVDAILRNVAQIEEEEKIKIPKEIRIEICNNSKD